VRNAAEPDFATACLAVATSVHGKKCDIVRCWPEPAREGYGQSTAVLRGTLDAMPSTESWRKRNGLMLETSLKKAHCISD
jgi:hypothetical protein